jgi:hypothetical protein
MNLLASDADSSRSRCKGVPSTAHFQFAGFIGMYSLGAGYHYWKERANSSLVYGYVPDKFASYPVHTIALKNTLRLFTINKSQKVIPAFYAGFSLNCEVSRHAFVILPDYYPNGYYGPQALHFTFFTGLKTKIPLKDNMALEPFAELGTLDSYLWYSYYNDEVDLDDVIRLALGLNFKLR